MFAETKRQLADDAVESFTRHGLVERFAQVRGLRGALDAYEARLLAAVNRLGDRGIDGAGVMRSVGRVSDREAARAARRAEGLEDLPAARAALTAGRITTEHVDSVVAAAKEVSPQRADSELVERAAATPADLFHKETREWATLNRPDEAGEELETQRRNRSGRKWVIRRTKMHGFYCQLDRVTGATVGSVLQKRYDELWHDDGGRDGAPDEVRTPEQRLADAFVELVTGINGSRATDRHCTVRLGHPKHQINAVYDVAGQTYESGKPLASLVVDGEPLPAAVLERLACDAVVTPMIFSGRGRPIWVGRDHRSATTAQWRALISRDRGCVGCGAGVNRCEAHHVVAWASMGSTDITNLVLVCSRCHHDIHDRNMLLRKSAGRWQIQSRDGPSAIPSAAGGPGSGQLILAT